MLLMTEMVLMYYLYITMYTFVTNNSNNDKVKIIINMKIIARVHQLIAIKHKKDISNIYNKDA